jgi:uncharacterized membrane protein
MVFNFHLIAIKLVQWEALVNLLKSYHAMTKCNLFNGPYYVIGYGGRAGVHTGFRTITLVLYIVSLPNLTT